VKGNATVIAANLLVPAGVLLFGWNIATAVFLIWLDALLYSLQLGVLVFALAKPTFAPPAGTPHPAAWRVGIGIGMAFFMPLFFVPPLVLGAELHDLLRPQFPQGPLAAAFSQRLIFLWIAIEVVVRGLQVLSRASELLNKPAAASSFGARAGYVFLGLMYRMVILLWLAWASAWFGRAGLLVFLFLAGALLAYTELHEDWVRHLYARFRLWEERLRSRAKDRSGR
jgi:hypothetical protein